MKITVDTKEDSTEDLKHMIKMLSALVESRGGSSNYSNDMPGMMNMFGDSPSSSASSSPSPQQDPAQSSIFNMDIPSASSPSPEKSSSSMFNIFGQEEKKKDDDYGIPKIIEYR
jgi:hypothetical protein